MKVCRFQKISSWPAAVSINSPRSSTFISATAFLCYLSSLRKAHFLVSQMRITPLSRPIAKRWSLILDILLMMPVLYFSYFSSSCVLMLRHLIYWSYPPMTMSYLSMSMLRMEFLMGAEVPLRVVWRELRGGCRGIHAESVGFLGMFLRKLSWLLIGDN